MIAQTFRRRVSVTLTVCLICGLPATGAAQRETRPLTDAAGREARRLAATADGPATPGTQKPSADGLPKPVNRLNRLVPGVAVMVTIAGSPTTTRYFISQNESALTVLNLTNPALFIAARVLREMASDHHEYVAGVQAGSTFVLKNDVRFGPDGVFVAGQKVAEVAQVIETIARRDLVVVTARPERSTASCAAAGVGGFMLGALGGGIAGALVGDALSSPKPDSENYGPLVAGATLGMLGGGWGGAIWLSGKCAHKPEEVVYRD